MEACYHARVAQKFGVVVLLLLLLLLVLPLGIGMAMDPCPACRTGIPMPALACLVALFLTFAPLAAVGALQAVRIAPARLASLLWVRDLAPPPRFSF